jgi:ligand-binding sensor domain-containing protein
MGGTLRFLSGIAVLLSPVLLFPGDWTSYTRAQGLASDSVTSIVVDPSGVKWFGTADGLSRFDGSAWTTFRRDASSLHTLADNRILAMAFENGWGPELWIGTEGGVSVMGIQPDAVTFATPYTDENRPLVSNRVNAVAVDSGHVKWFGTDRGISLFNGTRWDSVEWKHLSSKEILSFGFDKNTGMTYIGTRGGGVSRVKADSVDAVTSASPYESMWAHMPSDTIHGSLIEENGWQWFGTDMGLGFHQDTETKAGWTFFTLDSGMADDFVEVIVRDRDGLLWIGTHAGASLYDGIRWRNYSTADGLAGDVVFDIAVDLDGSLWFATNRGVSLFTRTSSSETVGRDVGGPEQFVLLSNYPNPFNPSTAIPFRLQAGARVTAYVVDSSGRRVRTLADGIFAAGSHTLTWSASGEDAAGVYLLRISVTGPDWIESKTQKMVLIK